MRSGDLGRSYLRVFSDTSFDLLASYQLGSTEIPTAVTSMAFGSGVEKADASVAGAAGSTSAAGAAGSSEESTAYFIVGTAVIKPNVSVKGLQVMCCPRSCLCHIRCHGTNVGW